MGEVRCWGEVEYFDQVEAKRMGMFIVSFAIDFQWPYDSIAVTDLVGNLLVMV